MRKLQLYSSGKHQTSLESKLNEFQTLLRLNQTMLEAYNLINHQALPSNEDALQARNITVDLIAIHAIYNEKLTKAYDDIIRQALEQLDQRQITPLNQAVYQPEGDSDER